VLRHRLGVPDRAPPRCQTGRDDTGWGGPGAGSALDAATHAGRRRRGLDGAADPGVTDHARSSSRGFCLCGTSTIGPFTDFGAVTGNNILWLAAWFTLQGTPASFTTISFRATTTSLTLAGGTNLTTLVPASTVTMTKSNVCSGSATWTSGAPGSFAVTGDTHCSGNTFMTAVQYQAPAGGIPANSFATWSMRFESLNPGTTFSIKWNFWTASFNHALIPNYNLLGIKPGDDTTFPSNGSADSHNAGYPENYGSHDSGASNGSHSPDATQACTC
jgi:hypothetical protein